MQTVYMPGQLIGICSICHKETVLDKTYFSYPIKCDCCSPQHFSVVYHCKDCVPKIPTNIAVMLKDFRGNKYMIEFNNIQPIEI